MTPHPMVDTDQSLLRYALGFGVSIAVVVLLLLTGCVHELKFIPQCDGEPAKQFPCIGACMVNMPAPSPAVRVMPNALVIRDHTGHTRCQEVEG